MGHRVRHVCPEKMSAYSIQLKGDTCYFTAGLWSGQLSLAIRAQRGSLFCSQASEPCPFGIKKRSGPLSSRVALNWNSLCLYDTSFHYRRIGFLRATLGKFFIHLWVRANGTFCMATSRHFIIFAICFTLAEGQCQLGSRRIALYNAAHFFQAFFVFLFFFPLLNVDFFFFMEF